MKTIKGVKKAVSELKDAQYGRIYFDNLSMKWIQEEVEEYLHYHRISK